MISRRSLLPLLPALALAHCGEPPSRPPVLTLTMIGSAEQNPDAAGKPAPVAVRIYQLTQTAKFERADVFALTEHEQQTLGRTMPGHRNLSCRRARRRPRHSSSSPACRRLASSCCIATSTTRSGAPTRRPRPADRRNSHSTSANLLSR